MSVLISDILPRTQIIATSGQTVFNADGWTVDETTDVKVYARADGVAADDATQLVSSSDYVVTLVGASETVRVTFSVGRTLDDVVTLVRDTPVDRENLYTNTNFTPSMLNQDFGITTLVEQQNELYWNEIGPRYNVSASLGIENQGDYPNADANTDLILPKLTPDQTWKMNSDASAIEAFDLPSSGGVAPDDATYITQTADAELPNSQALDALADGFMTSTTAAGVIANRTLTGTANEIGITNGTGASGDPVFGIVDNPTIPGTSHFYPPSGTTAQRPGTPLDGMVRYNTDANALEVYEATVWDQLSGGVVDSVVGTANEIDIDNTDPANPIASLSSTLVTPGTFTTGGTTSPASDGTSGQVFTTDGAGQALWSSITASGGVSVSYAAGTFTISGAGGGYTWVEVTGTSQAMAVHSGYIANNASLVTLTLPASSAVGDTLIVQGKGAGLFKIGQNAGQTINFGSSATTTGTGGSLTATNRYDSIELVCITATSDWAVLSGPQGTFSVV